MLEYEEGLAEIHSSYLPGSVRIILVKFTVPRQKVRLGATV